MSSFIVTTPTPAADEAVISPGPFWPDIDPAKVRETYRIAGAVPPARLKDALIEAMASVNGELAAWAERQQALGYATLAAVPTVPAEQIDAVSIHVHRYRRAVGCLTKALLTERYRDLDTTGQGDRKADVLENPIDDLRRDARWAITDIQGLGRTTVELI